MSKTTSAIKKANAQIKAQQHLAMQQAQLRQKAEQAAIEAAELVEHRGAAGEAAQPPSGARKAARLNLAFVILGG